MVAALIWAALILAALILAALTVALTAAAWPLLLRQRSPVLLAEAIVNRLWGRAYKGPALAWTKPPPMERHSRT